MSNFRKWFRQTLINEYAEGTSARIVPSLLFEMDLSRDGYRIIRSQFEPYVGQRIWWKKGFPPIPVGQEHLAKKPESPAPRAPQMPVHQPQPKPQISGPRNWVLADVIADNEIGLHQNTKVALSKRSDGHWDFVSLDSKQKGVLPGNEIAKVVKSVRDEQGQPIQADDPKKLRKVAMKPNPYQDAIVDAFKNTKDPIVISALAGTGKTTTLRQLSKLKKPNERWLYLVFNAKNQEEASKGPKSFQSGIEVKTTHSFLGQVLKSSAEIGAIPDTSLWDEKREGKRSTKIGKTLQQGNWFSDFIYQADVPSVLIYALKSRIKRLADLAKSFAIDPRSQQVGDELVKLIAKYRIDTTLNEGRKTPVQTGNRDFSKEIIQGALQLLNYTLPNNAPDPRHNSMRDHNDTLWWAAIHADELNWPKYDVVLTDEVQDFNRCQLIMLQHLAKRGARIVAVGDKNQSIYSFRGADSDAFDSLTKTLLPSGKYHELPVNFRSGKNIIDYVNNMTHVKNLKPGMDYEGAVSDTLKYEDAMDSVSKEWHSRKQLNMETAFISRTNKPLVHVALRLMRQKIPFVIIGREFADEIIKFIQEICGTTFDRGRPVTNVFDIEEFWRMMTDRVSKSEQLAGHDLGKVEALKEMKELSEALGSILEYLSSNNWRDPDTGEGVRSSEEFINYVQHRFGGLNVQDNMKDKEQFLKKMENPQGVVTLCTAHRSKGLEFDRVFIVRSDQFPHPSAKTEEEKNQENNAFYVAMTRAQHELHVISDKAP